MGTVNNKLLKASVSHAVDLVHYSNGVVQKIVALLNRSDKDLLAQLTQQLSDMDHTTFSVERLNALLVSVRTINAAAYAKVTGALEQEIAGFAQHEIGYQQDLFKSVIPPQIVGSVGIGEVAVQQVYAAALSRPFQGRLLKEWGQSLEQDRFTRIRDAIRIGFTQQQTNQQIIQRIRGTRANKFTDGIVQTDRRNLEAVVRTAVSHTAASAQDAFHKANEDLIGSVMWVATLDTSTTTLCAARDGKKYSVETHKPIGHDLPWLGGPGKAHWCCRSTSVPITKSWSELGGADLPSFTPSERSAMDGAAPADLTYSDWLKNQSVGRQNQVLGVTKAQLFRSGQLTIDQFQNSKGQTLTLDQLKARYTRAFSQAGL